VAEDFFYKGMLVAEMERERYLEREAYGAVL
jgi:hypothetical protein